ncbi:hypothetical protein L596_030546 [Steinernema carpocapsae]|uniref:BZIP domain-containing protein n=1 Tax=Steinernema carpocapsae TaxID=34508 RepID=A0A4U5LPQ1_STECR|nr:hypothetical protein L596_030546 [Steinernema carpocapsae]
MPRPRGDNPSKSAIRGRKCRDKKDQEIVRLTEENKNLKKELAALSDPNKKFQSFLSNERTCDSQPAVYTEGSDQSGFTTPVSVRSRQDSASDSSAYHSREGTLSPNHSLSSKLTGSSNSLYSTDLHAPPPGQISDQSTLGFSAEKPVSEVPYHEDAVPLYSSETVSSTYDSFALCDAASHINLLTRAPVSELKMVIAPYGQNENEEFVHMATLNFQFTSNGPLNSSSVFSDYSELSGYRIFQRKSQLSSVDRPPNSQLSYSNRIQPRNNGQTVQPMQNGWSSDNPWSCSNLEQLQPSAHDFLAPENGLNITQKGQGNQNQPASYSTPGNVDDTYYVPDRFQQSLVSGPTKPPPTQSLYNYSLEGEPYPTDDNRLSMEKIGQFNPDQQGAGCHRCQPLLPFFASVGEPYLTDENGLSMNQIAHFNQRPSVPCFIALENQPNPTDQNGPFPQFVNAQAQMAQNQFPAVEPIHQKPAMVTMLARMATKRSVAQDDSPVTHKRPKDRLEMKQCFESCMDSVQGKPYPRPQTKDCDETEFCFETLFDDDPPISLASNL